MELIRKEQGIRVLKKEGTDVTYHIFPEYEIHYNELTPGTVQQWHHHSVIEETLFLVSGNLEAHWIDETGKRMEILTPGDLVRVEDSPHTFVNSSGETVKFIVFRTVPDGIDKREIIKNDKEIDRI